ncbi:MAG TPA: hypothetical protein PLO62_08465 [Candidatus Hydrogenedentes bacterium]|nr:hypothetical protein [Candidatus Hydrogenedentota bacterium]HOS03114.1 hypothetical protein [Candidatus Hydrogenedentota bacterium]
MAIRVLTKKEADELGLVPRKTADADKAKRLNPHVAEIMEQVKGTKPGQFLVYEPSDKKSFQTQILRIRQAFDLLTKPWPFTRPMEGGKRTAIKILSKADSFEQYPQQEMAPKEKAASEKAKKSGRGAGRSKKRK